MKTKFKWLVIVFALLLSASTLFVACHKHEYGEWTVKIAPTETTAGTAERKCKDGDDAEEVELKPLSDTSFWTVSETAATHVADGSKKYTSAYVTVTITLPKLAHTFGDWTITVEPTLEAGGTAKRTCTANDGGEDTVTLPALSDTSVWTEKSSTPATHTTAGSAVYTSAYGEVTITLPKVAHTFGDWIITSEPTLEAGGTAKRTCSENDGGEETAALPALSDASVWTVEKRTNPTHVDTGSAVYASEYGKVTVTLPKIAHTFDGARWEIRTAPTKTTAGVAVRYCTANDGGEETVALPVLTDTSFWTATSVDASYNESGGIRYTSAYVTVFEEDSSKPKLVAPYDSKTYYPLGFMAGTSDYNKVCSVQTSWNRAELALDEKGSDADSSAYPFMGGTKVTMVDPSTGEVSINIAGETYKGYVDMSGKTDFIVMLHNNYVFLLTTEYKTEIVNVGADADECIEGTPTEVKSAYSTSTTPIASSWTVGVNTAMAITYEGKSGTGVNIFVYNDTVVFGVDFKDMSGNAVAADMCFDASCVYVIKNDEKLHGFGHDGEKMNILDGKEGVYTPEDTSSVQGTIVISGFGKITLEGVEGTYTVGENSIEAFIGGVFYNVNLLEGNEHRTEAPQITLHFNAGENGAVTPEQKTYGIKVVAELPVPTTSDSSLIFVGWAFDEAGTQLVPRDFKPEREHNTKTLYAVWKGKVTFTVTVDGNTETIYGAEGDVIGNLLPVIEKIDEENRRQFMGWEAVAQGSTDYRDLNTTSVLNAQYNGLSIRAKWEALAAYYGEYKGSSIRSGVYGTGYTLKIDENGNIVGDYDNNLGSANHTEIRGKVSGYNRDTQLITWQSDADNSIHYFMFDEASGVLLIDYQLSSTISTSFTAFVMDGDVNDVSAFRILAANYNSAHSRLLVISDGTTLVLDDRIHSNVSLENAYGEAITFTDFDNFMNEKRTQVGTYSFTIVVKAAGNEVVLARGVKITVALVTSSGSGSYGDGEGDYGEGEDYDDGETTTTLKTEETWYDLDAVYGVYTAAGETLKLDGMGGMVYGEKSGTYAAVSGNIYDVYLANRSEYYRMTLDTSAKTATMEFVEVDVNLDLGDITLEGFETSKRVNINVPYDLPVPNASAQKKYFGGWFTDAAHENAVATNDEGQYLVTLTGDTTFYALWHEAVTLTVVYNNGEADGSFELPWKTAKTLERPVKTGNKFISWYTLSQSNEEIEWISGETLVTEDTTVYAKWGEPHAFYGTYRYANLDPSETGIVKETDTYSATSGILTIDEYGKASGQTNGVIEEYNEQTGRFVLNNNGSLSKGGADLANGVLYFDYSSGKTEEPYHDIKFFVKINGEVGAISSFNNAWDKGCTKLVRVTYSDNATKELLIYNRIVYGGISWTAKKADGSELTDFEKIYSDAQILTISKDGATLFKFGRLNNNFVSLDGYEDINYTGTLLSENVTLAVDGAANVTVGEKTGTYSLAPAGSAYTADMYFDGKYFELTLDKTAKTFSVNMPMVTISFMTEFESAAAQTVNKNIGIDLPALTHDGQYLVGWYTSSDFAEGTEVVLTNGKFIPESDITLYAKWIVPHALMGTYKGYEFDTSTLRSSLTTLTVDVFGNFTGQYTGKIESYENGVVTLSIGSSRKYAYYDSASGTLVTNYGTSASTALSTDLYVLIKASDDDAFASSDSPNYIRWNNNKTKLGKFKINGEDKYFFVYENKVYGNVGVSVKASDDSEVTSMSDFANNGNVMTISRNNAELFKFGHNGTTFVLDDGTAGDYTGSLGSIHSDGYGHLTVGGETVDVTIDENGKLHFVASNAMRVISLNDGTYTLEQDGYAGTYTLPDGTTTVTLDGNGNAGSGSTYVVSGSNITVYTSDETAKYGIDVTNKLFLGKSVFAGQTYTGRGKDVWGDDSPMKIVFDDDSSISGIFYNSGDLYTYKFTAELSGNILTLTFTEVPYDKSSVGKTLTAEVTDNTIKLVSTTITSSYKNCVGSVLTLVA